MPSRIPNTNSPSEVRQAFQRVEHVAGELGDAIDVVEADIVVIEADIVTIEADIVTIEADITALDSRVGVIEDFIGDFSAETDSDVVIGHVLYVKVDSHVDLAYADSPSAYKAIGFATEAKSAGVAVEYRSDGKLTLADWTAIIGTTELAPGVNYYLAEQAGASGTPSYANTGGTGDRTAIIAITSDVLKTGDWTRLIDGAFADGVFWLKTQNVAGLYIRFDFGSGVSKIITEAKWYQGLADAQGVWRWQGSDDASSWTNIGSSFTLAGVLTQTQTELSGNSIGYRYYQLLGVSGATVVLKYQREIEFKIDNYSPGIHGKLTTIAPTTGGSYVVRVGRAISVTTLDIEVEQPVLL